MNERTFAEVLKSLLEKSNLSQAEIVRKMEKIGVRINDAYLSRLKKGHRANPTQKIVLAIAHALSLSLSDTNILLKFAGHPYVTRENIREYLKHIWKPDIKTWIDPVYDYLEDIISKYSSVEEFFVDFPIDVFESISPLEVRIPYEPEINLLFHPQDRSVLRKHYECFTLDILTVADRFVVLGESGAGKTTFLHYITLRTAQNAQFGNPQNKIPVFIDLSIYSSNESFLSFVTTFLSHTPLGVESIENGLYRGSFLFLLDGINEMPTTKGWDRMREISQFVDKYSIHGNKFILSCREVEYDFLPQYHEVMIPPLTEEGIRSVLKRAFNESYQEVYWELDYDERLWSMAKNPFMLQMIVAAISRHQEIPRNRALLIQEFVNILLFREFRKKGESSRGMRFNYISERWNNRLIIEALGSLAYSISIDNVFGGSVSIEQAKGIIYEQSNISWNEFVEVTIPANLIHINHEFSSLRFSHQIFQEYFTAMAIKKRGTTEVFPLVKNFSWDEVFVILSGLLEDSSDLISDITLSEPFLAARCVNGANRVNIATKRQVSEKLMALAQNCFLFERHTIIAALADLGPDIGLESLFTLSHDEDAFDSALLYIKKFAEKNREAMERLGRLVLSDEIPSTARAQIAQALGDIPTAGSQDILAKMLAIKDSNTVLKALEAIDKILYKLASKSSDLSKKVKPFLKHKNRKVKVAAANILAAEGFEDIIPVLLPLLSVRSEDEDIGYRIEVALSKFPAKVLFRHLLKFPGIRKNIFDCGYALSMTADFMEQIPSFLQSKSPVAIDLVAEAIAFRIPSPETSSIFRSLLTSKHPAVRLKACYAFNHKEAEVEKSLLPDFIKTLTKMSDSPVMQERHAATIALGRLGQEQAIPGLVDVLTQSKSPIERGLAAEILGEMHYKGAVPEIAELVKKDTDSWIEGKSCVEALVMIHTPESFKALVAISDIIVSKEKFITSWETYTKGLASFGEEAVPLLISFLKHRERNYRFYVVKSLKGFENTSIFQSHFAEAIESPEAVVGAIELVGQLYLYDMSSKIIDIFNKSRSEEVRYAAMETLIALRELKVLPLIEKVIQDPNSEISNIAFVGAKLLRKHHGLPKW